MHTITYETHKPTDPWAPCQKCLGYPTKHYWTCSCGLFGLGSDHPQEDQIEEIEEHRPYGKVHKS